MTTTGAGVSTWTPPDFDLDRVRNFSDCVFAVAITIVVVAFVTPERALTDAGVTDYLLNEWPRYVSYLGAFAVIGYFWMAHHRLFELMVRIDVRGLWLNLVLLAFVVLLPYPMQVLGWYRDDPVSHVLFASAATLIAALYVVVLVYATAGHRLTAPALPRSAARILVWRAAVLPVAFACAAALSFSGQDWPIVGWLVPLVLGHLVVRWVLGPMPAVTEELEDGTATGGGAALAWARRGTGSLTRLLSFSDNVYAFAITLLVLQLKLPKEQLATEADLVAYLTDRMSPDVVGYFLGFAVIGLFWTMHNRHFLLIDRQNPILRVSNLVHLFTIAVLPFSTLVLSTYPAFVAPTVLYALSAVVASTTLAGVWWYASLDHRLVTPDAPDRELHRLRMRSLVTPVGFLVSVPVALASPVVARLVWLVPFAGGLSSGRDRSRR